MNVSFRGRFYSGLTAALLCGLFLLWLWQPERQVRRHTEKLLHQIEARKWSKVTDLIDDAYVDQWGNNRARVLERMLEVTHYMRGLHINTEPPLIDNRNATWSAKVTIDGDAGEAMALVKERINFLSAPFELEWRPLSVKSMQP
jgi:hypothetical protein